MWAILLVACAYTPESYMEAENEAYCEALDRCGEGLSKEECLALYADSTGASWCADIDQEAARKCIAAFDEIACDGEVNGNLDGDTTDISYWCERVCID